MGKRKQFRHAAGRTAMPAGGESAAVGSPYWLFGVHPVAAALRNPRRRLHRLAHTPEAAAHHPEIVELAGARAAGAPRLESAAREALDRLLPPGAVHQGLALLAEPLPAIDLFEICDDLAAVDQAALVVTERHAAAESGILAKAASGALEHVPVVGVTNLARALETIKEAGVWCMGLAAEAGQTLAAATLAGKVAIVLGAEGAGLRRLTRERCDLLVRLPTGGPIADLNVSNAAAVALYELARRRPELPAAESRS